MSGGRFDPRELFRALGRREVEYVTVGGVAIQAQGAERFTRDLDVAIAASRDNIRMATQDDLEERSRAREIGGPGALGALARQVQPAGRGTGRFASRIPADSRNASSKVRPCLAIRLRVRADLRRRVVADVAPAAFRRRAEQGSSHRLDAVDETFAILKHYRAATFAIWTTEESHLPLRNKASTTLAPPYAELLHDLRRMMQSQRNARGRKAMLFFDQRGHSEDLAMACAVQNYIMRTSYSWRRHFLQVPHFTRSAVSPGLQAADLIAYLAGRQIGPQSRSELIAYWGKVARLGYVHRGAKTRSALRLVA